MRNAVRYLGLSIVIVILLVNTVALNKVTKQNNDLEYKLLGLEQMLNEKSVYNNSNQIPQMPKKVAKDVMTPLDLADYLGIKMDKVYDLVENKDSKIPYICIDGEYRFSRNAIDEWMKTSKEITIRN